MKPHHSFESSVNSSTVNCSETLAACDETLAATQDETNRLKGYETGGMFLMSEVPL